MKVETITKKNEVRMNLRYEDLGPELKTLLDSCLNDSSEYLEDMSEARLRNWLTQYRSTLKRLRSVKRDLTPAEVGVYRQLRLIEHFILAPKNLINLIARHKAESDKRRAKMRLSPKVILRKAA